jgi:hypothetical protein
MNPGPLTPDRDSQAQDYRLRLQDANTLPMKTSGSYSAGRTDKRSKQQDDNTLSKKTFSSYCAGRTNKQSKQQDDNTLPMKTFGSASCSTSGSPSGPSAADVTVLVKST